MSALLRGEPDEVRRSPWLGAHERQSPCRGRAKARPRSEVARWTQMGMPRPWASLSGILRDKHHTAKVPFLIPERSGSLECCEVRQSWPSYAFAAESGRYTTQRDFHSSSRQSVARRPAVIYPVLTGTSGKRKGGLSWTLSHRVRLRIALIPHAPWRIFARRTSGMH